MKKGILAIVMAVALFGFGVLPAFASDVCQEGDSGKIDLSGDDETYTIVAEPGFLITQYCVKAGSSKQGEGPEYVTVVPPASSVEISHSSGKGISHYSFIVIEDPTVTTTTTAQPTTTTPTSIPTTTTVPPGSTTTTTASVTSTTIVEEDIAFEVYESCDQVILTNTGIVPIPVYWVINGIEVYTTIDAGRSFTQNSFDLIGAKWRLAVGRPIDNGRPDLFGYYYEVVARGVWSDCSAETTTTVASNTTVPNVTPDTLPFTGAEVDPLSAAAIAAALLSVGSAIVFALREK